MIRLALLRHGHTAWNRAGRIQGSSDIPLDASAETELSGLALPSEWRRAELRSSPLLRAARTAELVGGRTPRTDPALREMHWGNWEGLRGEDLLADPASGYRHIEDWGWDFRPPGGESPREVKDRLLPWLGGLERDTVAVCHIGIMRVILALAHRWDFRGPAPFRVKRARLYILHVGETIAPVPDEPVRLIPKDPP